MVQTESFLTSSFDWEDGCARDRSTDTDVCYLNHASQMPLDPVVVEAGMEAIRCPPWSSCHHVQDDQEAVRRLFANLVSAESKDIAIMPSTAFAMTLAAHNIQRLFSSRQRQPRSTTSSSRIVLLQDQMCSAVYAWQQLCDEEEHLALDIVPYPKDNNGGWTKAILERLDENVLVACLPPVHWSDGATIDLQLIGEQCRSYDIHLIVDATQAVGIMEVDVPTIRPTMVAASVHKWLSGPIGASLVYMNPSVVETWTPLDQHGRSRQVVADHPYSWDAAQNEIGPRGYPSALVKDARKFDSGGKPNPVLLAMIRAGLELVVQQNVNDMQKQLEKLVGPIRAWAKTHGFCVTPGSHAHHIVGIRPCANRKPKMTPQDMVNIANKLENEEQIYIAVRCGAFRISPYIDTTPSDIQMLLEGLERYCV